MPMRIRPILFMLACAELGACRPRPRATAPVVASEPRSEPRAATQADAAWLANATRVVLADGRQLYLGGGTTRAAIFDGSDLVELAPMPESRDLATASLLPDGRVLIAGGIQRYEEEGGPVVAETTLLWSLDDGFAPGPPLATPRCFHTATTLLDGDVLVVGGDDTCSGLMPVANAERFVVAEGRWRPAGTLLVARSGHTANLLPDGRVIVIGGEDMDLGTTAQIELWDELAGGFVDGGTLQQSRESHDVQVVSAVEVVVSGGVNVIGPDEGPPERTDLDDVEILHVPPRPPRP